MPHAARLWPVSNIHLVAATGNGHCRLFLDEADRDLFLDLLDDVVERFGWALFAWCLLGTISITEWSSFRTSARLAPAPRRHLTCQPFDRLLQLDAAPDRHDVLRAYVRENGAGPR